MKADGLISHICPYPFVLQGKLVDGTIHKQLNICGKCEKRDCGTFIGKPCQHYTCSKGFSCYPVTFSGTNFVLNGLIASDINTVLVGKKRKPYKANTISQKDVSTFCEHARSLGDAIASGVAEEVKDSLAFLHDIRTSVGAVLGWCEEVIASGDGFTFEEKLRFASEDMVGLYQSINLLKEQLNLADIIPNPNAITYGARNRSSINGFLYKMHKIFEPRFRRRGLQIYMEGFTKARVEAHNSIQFIPLILLDNALKYSARGRTTFIRLSEDKAANLIKVAVSSYGLIVPEGYQDRIFEKYVRGPGATEINPQGMGLGLYIAQQIAAAHGFVIRYNSSSSDGVNGMSDFHFTMPICGYES